jgi:diguanylate cyclase (GGDEF)-like protein
VGHNILFLFEPNSVMLTGGIICFLMASLLVWQASDNQEHKVILLQLAACLIGGSIALVLAVTDSFFPSRTIKYSANTVGTMTYYFATMCMINLYRPKLEKTVPNAIAIISVIGCLLISGENAFYAWNQLMRIAFMAYTAYILAGARDPAAPGLRYVSLSLPFLSAFGMAPQLLMILAQLDAAPLPLVDSSADGSRFQALAWAISPSLVYIAVTGVIHARTAHRLRESVYVDVLTGAHSRRYLLEKGANLIDNNQGGDLPTGTSLLLIDVDHFKVINDTWGHLIGDAVLRHCVSCIREIVRSEDSIVSRYGGEEFCVMLPATDLVAAANVAERTRAYIASRPYVHGDCEIPVTVSIGVAQQSSQHCTFSSVLSQADQSMYVAKDSGRNQVVAHPLAAAA